MIIKTKESRKLKKYSKLKKSATFRKQSKNKKRRKLTFVYAPCEHPFKVMKMWERKIGKSWYDLTVEERFQANEDMKQMISKNVT